MSEATRIGLACGEHEEREAATRCSRCDAPLCDECIAPGNAADLCFPCSIEDASKHLERTVTAPPGTRRSARSKRGPSPVVRVALIAGAIVVSGQLVYLQMTAPVPRSSSGPTNRDESSARRSATAAAAADTFVLHSSLEHHKATTGRYPATLAPLVNDLPGELRTAVENGTITYERDDQVGYRLRVAGEEAMPLASDGVGGTAVPQESAP
jgi:hypothetical protein